MFFQRDEAYQVSHPVCSGDDCTVFTFAPALLREAVHEHTPEPDGVSWRLEVDIQLRRTAP